MKSQRRHELQQNVLDSELSKIIDFLKRRGNIIAWSVLIAALFVFAIVGITKWQTGKAEGLQNKFDRLVSDPTVPVGERREGLKALAAQGDNERIAALASVRLGDELAGELMIGAEKLTAAQIKTLADQATASYDDVIRRFKDFPQQVAQAHVGLGKLAEARGDFDRAKTEYQAALSLPGLAGQPILDVAQRSLTNLSTLRQTVIMAATAPAEEETPKKTSASKPASGPASKPASAPASKPVARGPAKAAPTASKANPAATTRPVGNP